MVDVVTPGKTPWKAILIAETPGKLLDNNDMILNLNQDCTLDFSWVKTRQDSAGNNVNY